jgi:hypothetical protein
MSTTQTLLAYFADTPMAESVPSIWYPSVGTGTPDILFFRMPQVLSGSGGFQAVFVENDEERRLADLSLDLPMLVNGNSVSFRKSIIELIGKDSTLPPTGSTQVILYSAPAPGWPFLVVAVGSVNRTGLELGRTRYGWETFRTKGKALAYVRKLCRL